MTLQTQDLVARITTLQPKGARRLVALAGPPASGKSTVAEALVTALNAAGDRAVLVPMDGFHLDNRLLEPRGLLPRKGAPQTFDAGGFVNLIKRLSADAQGDTVFPVFDRSLDCAIAGAGCVGPDVGTVVIEGNYLLLNTAPWAALQDLWDLSIALDVPRDILRDRLVARWVAHGLDAAAALARAEGNDLANADTIRTGSAAADMIWDNSGQGGGL